VRNRPSKGDGFITNAEAIARPLTVSDAAAPAALPKKSRRLHGPCTQTSPSTSIRLNTNRANQL
jgi:hypothetical protein